MNASTFSDQKGEGSLLPLPVRLPFFPYNLSWETKVVSFFCVIIVLR